MAPDGVAGTVSSPPSRAVSGPAAAVPAAIAPDAVPVVAGVASGCGVGANMPGIMLSLDMPYLPSDDMLRGMKSVIERLRMASFSCSSSSLAISSSPSSPPLSSLLSSTPSYCPDWSLYPSPGAVDGVIPCEVLSGV